MATSASGELENLAERIGRAVRAARTDRGMSLGELGRESGLSKTILARIESGAGNPSVETLWRLSRALALPLGDLIAEEREPLVRVIRARSGEELHAQSGMSAWLVHAQARARRCELMELWLPRGVEQRNDGHLAGTEELVFCVSGRVLAGPSGREAELTAGDAVWFAADVPHRYRGVRDARALDWILYPVGTR